MMQDYELDAYLGDTEATPERRDAIRRASDAIDARWPDPDLTDIRTEAMNAALAVILGDETDTAIAAEWATIRQAERTAHARLTGAIIAGRLLAYEPEERHAARLGVSRVTLRKALSR